MIKEIEKTARLAGKLIIESAERGFTEKGKGNFVTKCDLAVQNFIMERLSALLPDAAFMGEENGYDSVTGGKLFIVDPIDGTTNFIHGCNHSCVSIAYAENGEPIIGVVYDPYRDEMFSAVRGSGAFLNGKKIQVTKSGLENSLVLFGSSPYYPELSQKTFDTLKAIFPFIADVRRTGSAALDICYIAAGRCDLFFEHILSPWDFAAGAVILTEAGGVIKAEKGRSISISHTSAIAAGNDKIYAEFADMTNF